MLGNLPGFVYATGALLLFYLARISRLGVVRSIMIAVASSAGVYFGIQRLLELPLPDGLLVEAMGRSLIEMRDCATMERPTRK